MYEYRYSLVKHHLPNVHYEEIDLRTRHVRDLMSDFSDVYIVLTNPHMTGSHTLTMSEVPASLLPLDPQTTVSEWLVAIGTTTLPTVPGEPQVTTREVLSKDAWQAGYKADLCLPVGIPGDHGMDADKIDIWLRRDDTDYFDVQGHCLATMNGLVHRLDGDEHGIYIKDAGTTFSISGDAMLGLISFKNIGKVDTYNITPEMVYHPQDTRRYSDQFYVTLPFDSTDKVVGIVIGGYLHLASNDIAVTGPHTLKVEMNKIPFLERYMLSRYQMDQSSMERFHETGNGAAHEYDLQGFYSNECILELLSLSQSFIVAIETPHLTSRTSTLTRTRLPGRFYSDERPVQPLKTQLGLLPSYLSEEETGVWVLRIGNNLVTHRFIDTYDYKQDARVDEKRISGEPHTFSKGELIHWQTHHLSIVSD